jgi:hypothetical protein
MSHILINIPHYYLSLTTVMVVNRAFRDLLVIGPAFPSAITEAIPLLGEHLSYYYLYSLVSAYVTNIPSRQP